MKQKKHVEIEIEPSSARRQLNCQEKLKPSLKAEAADEVVDDDEDEYEIEIVDDTPATGRMTSSHQRTLLTRSLRTTLKKYVNAFSTSLKGT